MIVAWVINALVVTALVALAAAGFAAVARLIGRPTRFVWAAAMVLAVALALVTPLRAGRVEEATVGDSPNIRVVATSEGVVLSTNGVRGPTLAEQLARFGARYEGFVARTSDTVPPNAARAVGVLLIASSALVALWFVAGALRWSAERRRWPTAEVAGERVRIASTIGPAVMGFVRSEIVIPQWLLALTPKEQSLVVTHEREHLRARDPLLMALACSCVAMMPWHPAAWWMLSRLQLAMELDCDRRLLTRGISAREYGELLIDIGARARAGAFALTAFAHNGSHLSRRLDAMTGIAPKHRSPRAIFWGGVSTAILLVACQAKARGTAAGGEAEKSASAASADAASDSSITFAYEVDGKPVSRAEAYAIPPERMFGIESALPVRGKPTVLSINLRAPGDTNHRSAEGSGEQTRMTVAEAEANVRKRLLHPPRTLGESDSMNRNLRELILLDGVPITSQQFADLEIKSIAHIESVMPDSAVKLSKDPRAKLGIVLVTSKAKAKKISLPSTGNSPSTPNLTYNVDGRIVPAADARAIAPKRIVAVETFTPFSGQTVIFITTTQARRLLQVTGPVTSVAAAESIAARERSERTLRERAISREISKVLPLVMVDGQPVSDSSAGTLPLVGWRKIDRIAPNEAIKLSNDPRAANGIIKLEGPLSAKPRIR